MIYDEYSIRIDIFMPIFLEQNSIILRLNFDNKFKNLILHR